MLGHFDLGVFLLSHLSLIDLKDMYNYLGGDNMECNACKTSDKP